MKAKKLPSGSWRARVFWTEVKDGRTVRRSRSFTAADRKSAELAAALFEREHEEQTPANMTVGAALDAFIKARAAAVSPSTLRGYKSSRRSSYARIEAVPLSSVDSRTVQDWLDDFKRGRSPKTVANNYMLLQSALTMFRPSLKLRVILPQRQQAELFTPTDADIKKLLASFSGSDMEKCVILAAFGTLRRSEICALTRADVNENFISVNKALVYDGAQYVVKCPKTASSARVVELPQEVIKTLLSGTERAEDRLVNLTPNAISVAFHKAVKRAGLPPFRFHDLRAYSASIRHALGIPTKYIMSDGGWNSPAVLDRVYKRALADKRKEFSKVSNSHFSTLLN